MCYDCQAERNQLALDYQKIIKANRYIIANSQGRTLWQMHHGGRNADSMTLCSHRSSHASDSSGRKSQTPGILPPPFPGITQSHLACNMLLVCPFSLLISYILDVVEDETLNSNRCHRKNNLHVS